MLLNQTDVAVDEELEKVIKAIDRGLWVGLRVLFQKPLTHNLYTMYFYDISQN